MPSFMAAGRWKLPSAPISWRRFRSANGWAWKNGAQKNVLPMWITSSYPGFITRRTWTNEDLE
ncbi:MAG: hypothetical protein COC01_09580 [Bacteroidetes bacterium]|nr:MAG: hypothetical protein COC01_09580 [Bacteroidota bacterium]